MSLEAYTIYLRAMQLSHDNSEASLREAVELFERVISKEPGFVRAFAGLAHALCGLAAEYADFKSSAEKAEAVAKKAVELGPDVAEAYLAMAYVHTYMDKFELVVSEAERAIGSTRTFPRPIALWGGSTRRWVSWACELEA